MNKLSLYLIPRVYKLTMLALTSSCRVQRVGYEHLERLESDRKNWIYCGWHNNVGTAVWMLRRQNLAIMTSDSTDGELITRAVEIFGNWGVRGSTSAGGNRAARAMVKALKDGHSAAVTPDGPRGPKYVLQPGALTISALSGCPLIPYHLEATRQWEFNSWDGHKIPKPFATIYESLGEPFFVDRESLQAKLGQVTEEFQQRMMTNVSRCRELAGRPAN